MENEVKIYEVKKVFEEFTKKNEIDDCPEITFKSFLVPGKKLTQVIFFSIYFQNLTNIITLQISWSFLNQDLIASTDDGSLINFSLEGSFF